MPRNFAASPASYIDVKAVSIHCNNAEIGALILTECPRVVEQINIPESQNSMGSQVNMV